jgi:hypothetical protein
MATSTETEIENAAKDLPAQLPAIKINRLSFGQQGEYTVVLCPLGHLLDQAKMDKDFAHSHFEANLGLAAAGRETIWHRRALVCRGAGH